MPVGNKLNHNDPEWRKKLQQRIYKREWQRAKRANDKGDVAATAATVEENNPPPHSSTGFFENKSSTRTLGRGGCGSQRRFK